MPARKDYTELLEYVRRGHSHAEAGARYGLTRQRASQIVAQYDRSRIPGFLPFRAQWWGRENYWFHEDALRHIENEQQLIMLLPPGHTKTMTWSIEYSAWNLIHDPNYRITVIQKSADEAEKVVTAVQQRLADHEFYAALGHKQEDNPISNWGPFRPEKRYRESSSWASTAITVLGRNSGEKEPSLQAKGAGSAILSTRADLIVVDDMQEPLKDTPTQTDNLLRWFQQSVLTRLYANQKVIVLGSRLGPTDIYARLMDEYPDWPVVRYPAILPACRACMLAEHDCPHPEPERMLWPGYEGGYEGLMKVKARVRTFWFTSFMQEEGDASAMVFKPQAIEEAKDRDLVLGVVPPKVDSVFIGCDPAIVGYCAIITWGLDSRTGTRYLIDIFNERDLSTFRVVQNRIREYVERYHPRVVAIELNNVQGSISNDPEFVRHLRGLGARVETYQTRTNWGARAELDDFDISSIGALFDGGLVVLPYGNEDSRQRVDAYCTQLMEWRPKPPEHRSAWKLVRDMVMATLFAESQAMEHYRRTQGQPARTHRRLDRVPAWARNRRGGWPWQKVPQPDMHRLTLTTPVQVTEEPAAP